MDTVPEGFSAAGNGSKIEWHDLGIKQSQNPVQGSCVRNAVICPAHTLGIGNGCDDGRTDLREDLFGTFAATCLFGGNIDALFGLLLKDITLIDALCAQKSQKGLPGFTIGIIGNTQRRSCDDFLAYFLTVCQLLNLHTGSAGRAEDIDAAKGKPSFR